MRRQPPRASPNCTRVFGPIDATTRELRSGPPRTTTHLRATVFTQTTRVGRDFAGALATVLAGSFGGAFTEGAGFFDAVVARAAGFVVGARAGELDVVRSGARATTRCEDFVAAARAFGGAGAGVLARVDSATRGRSASRGATGSGAGADAVSDCATRIVCCGTICGTAGGTESTTGVESAAAILVVDCCAIESEIAATTVATD